MDAEHDDILGPLPKSHRANDLERLGIDALSRALPTTQFLYRDERIDDKGVDGSLELKIRGHFTNLRSQLQLKSTDTVALNQDGSASLQVESSNFNYLLNGPSPLYVLYIGPREELRFVWAYDEYRRLDADNPGWRSQQTVTLRFAAILTKDAVTAIHERIRREAQSNRRIREILARTTITEDVVVAVNPASLSVTDPDELYRFLSTAGMTAICAGYPRQVLERVRLLSTHARAEPRICLLCAYAEHTLGRLAASLSHLVEIAPRERELVEYDRHFFVGLRNACLFQIGLITEEQFQEREAALAATASGLLALQRQLRELNKQVMQAKDRESAHCLLDSYQELVDAIVGRKDVNEPFKLHARIELLKAQGSLLIDEFSFAVAAKGMRDDLGIRYDTSESIARANAVLGRKIAWVAMGNAIITDAASLGHPILFGNALLASSFVIVTMLGQRRILAGAKDVPAAVVSNLFEHIDKAIEMFVHAGALERELRARMLRADMHEFLGDRDAAHRIAEDVLPKADAMGYSRIVADANAHLTGESTWQRDDSRLAALTDQDPDPSIAKQSDEQVCEFAEYIRAALEVPHERLQAIERHLKCMRDTALERLTWCRHLIVIGEDETFATAPERRCACQAYGYKSDIGEREWRIVIPAFKQAYCDGCPAREPKGA